MLNGEKLRDTISKMDHNTIYGRRASGPTST